LVLGSLLDQRREQNRVILSDEQQHWDAISHSTSATTPTRFQH
jgi:hypothetical protein